MHSAKRNLLFSNTRQESVPNTILVENIELQFRLVYEIFLYIIRYLYTSKNICLVNIVILLCSEK